MVYRHLREPYRRRKAISDNSAWHVNKKKAENFWSINFKQDKFAK